MSTLIFLLIFEVAFILIKFLGADIAGGTGIDKPKRLKKTKEEDTSNEPEGEDIPLRALAPVSAGDEATTNGDSAREDR